MDGVIEGHTGLLDTPYKDRPNFVGEQTWKWSELQTAAVDAAKAGFQLHFHAIGDAACSMALNAIAAAETATGNTTPRDGITHLQLVTPTDIVRMAQLNVTAVPQPYWFVKDSFYYDIQLPFLGKWRADHEYPMKSFFDNGVLVARAATIPVTIPPNPIDAIATGVMRWYRGGSEWAVKGPADVSGRPSGDRPADDRQLHDQRRQGQLPGERDRLHRGRQVGRHGRAQPEHPDRPSTQISKASVMLTVFQGRPV